MIYCYINNGHADIVSALQEYYGEALRFRNPKYWRGQRERDADFVLLYRDHPAIRGAYEAVDVPVETVQIEDTPLGIPTSQDMPAEPPEPPATDQEVIDMPTPPPPARYLISSKGFGWYDVVDETGTAMNTQGLRRDDAEQLAHELNHER